MHYFNWNISDYMSHTSHLNEMEDLAYRRMLDWLYLHEILLPKDVEEIARVIRMRSHSDSIAVVLLEFFEEHNEGWWHKRVDKELDAFRVRSEKAKKSAEARWSKNKASVDANASKTQCHTKQSESMLYKNQEPITNNQLVISPKAKTKPKTKNAKNKPKTKLPNDFELTQERGIKAMKYWQKKNRRDLNPRLKDIFDKFKNHHIQHGSSMANWEAAWQTWYTNAPDFEKKPMQGMSKLEFEHERARKIYDITNTSDF